MRVMAICVVSAVVGLLCIAVKGGDDYDLNHWRIGEIQVSELKLRFSSIIVVDARSPAEYANGRIPGSILVSTIDWDAGLIRLFQDWNLRDTLVVYCDSGGCDLSKEVALRLVGLSRSANILILRGGYSAWLASEGRAI